MVSMSYEAEAGRHRHVDNLCSDKLEMTVAASSCPITDSYSTPRGQNLLSHLPGNVAGS